MILIWYSESVNIGELLIYISTSIKNDLIHRIAIHIFKIYPQTTSFSTCMKHQHWRMICYMWFSYIYTCWRSGVMILYKCSHKKCLPLPCFWWWWMGHCGCGGVESNFSVQLFVQAETLFGNRPRWTANVLKFTGPSIKLVPYTFCAHM